MKNSVCVMGQKGEAFHEPGVGTSERGLFYTRTLSQWAERGSSFSLVNLSVLLSLPCLADRE